MKILLLSLSGLALAGLALFSSGCGAPKPPETAVEPPPVRGHRDRVMSELHGTRKQLTDALTAMSAEAFVAPGKEASPSAAARLATLVRVEKALLEAMQGSKPGTAAHPMEESEGLSREERQKRYEEFTASMQSSAAACLERYPESAWAAGSADAKPKADAEAEFRTVRDATIAYARETPHNFLRRTVEFPGCASMNLMTAMMTQAELTGKLVERLK
ncbi:MAG: DinB family protein [Bryobacterales bacterium]|jgi:uncharacterized damage-inducible protein DinB|nr:DinB family protein [Bryobacterales bacterium]